MSELQPGLVFETTREVTRKESAQELGSGTVDVFGTPAMALFVEQACVEMVDHHLGDGKTSVGVKLSLSHLAPTPIGDFIKVKVEVISVDDRMIHFSAKIWDSVELIGEVVHQRAIIDIERFQQRVEKKSSDLSIS